MLPLNVFSSACVGKRISRALRGAPGLFGSSLESPRTQKFAAFCSRARRLPR